MICDSPACLEKASGEIAPQLFWPGVEPWPRQLADELLLIG